MLALIAKNIGQGNGAAQSALDVLISLGQIDPKMELIYLYKSPLPESIDGKNVQYSKSYLSPRYIEKKSKFNLKKIVNFMIKPFLIKKLENVNPKMAFINSMGSHSLWEPIKKKYNWPSTLIIRESPDLYKKENLHNIIARFRYYDYFIFVSNIVKQKWLKLVKINDNKCFFIPNCIRENDVNNLLKKSKTDIKKQIYKEAKTFIVLCIGEVKFRKGQDIIITNLEAISDKIPNLKVIFLGRQNQIFLKQLQSTLKNIEVKNRVEFIAHTTNALEYIYGADMLIQPSRSEALPRTILEAMSLKTPILASDVDGIPELVQHNKSAFLFSLSNPNQIIEGIEKIYLNKSYDKKIVDDAYKSYWEKFSRNTHINNYKKFIDTVINA